MAKPKSKLEETKRLMGALLGMKPKHHEDMKLGKKKREPGKPSPRRSAKKINKNG